MGFDYEVVTLREIYLAIRQKFNVYTQCDRLSFIGFWLVYQAIRTAQTKDFII